MRRTVTKSLRDTEHASRARMRVGAATQKRSLQQQPTKDAGRQVNDIAGTGVRWDIEAGP